MNSPTVPHLIFGKRMKGKFVSLSHTTDGEGSGDEQAAQDRHLSNSYEADTKLFRGVRFFLVPFLGGVKLRKVLPDHEGVMFVSRPDTVLPAR